jgi:hypothetical protein
LNSLREKADGASAKQVSSQETRRSSNKRRALVSNPTKCNNLSTVVTQSAKLTRRRRSSTHSRRRQHDEVSAICLDIAPVRNQSPRRGSHAAAAASALALASSDYPTTPHEESHATRLERANSNAVLNSTTASAAATATRLSTRLDRVVAHVRTVHAWPLPPLTQDATAASTAPLLSAIVPPSIAEAVLAAHVPVLLAGNPALVLPALQPAALQEQQHEQQQQLWHYQQQIDALRLQLFLL